MGFDTDFNTQRSETPSSFQFNWKKHKRFVVIGAVLLLLIVIGSTCWYTVDDKQQGVVTTFGKVTNITDAGMHFKLPFGIQKVHKVEANIFQKIELGYRTESGSPTGYKLVEGESKMITGDYNIVNVEFFVEYKISDPKKYLFSSYNTEEILRNLVQSQVRNVVGSTNVDAVLTTGKELIQQQVKELIAEVLGEYDIGLMLTDVKIQDSDPPTEEVIAAFKEVETAKQGADTVMNQAKAYENAELPKAQAAADSLLQNAAFLKQSRINDATERIAMFNAIYKEYEINPAITKSRMYYEVITKLLPDVKVYIDTTEGGVSKMLPLESFFGAGQNSEKGAE
ncbi:MAG: FtsH protease activity modulator HflK [Eubacteriales bacterium]|nr:FtsH protease activity modulator HflK [Eubacteriales bacterium]